MRKHFEKAFDDSLDAFPALAASTGLDLASWFLGESEVASMRKDTVAALMAALPVHMATPQVLAYIDGALGIELTLRKKMVHLPHKVRAILVPHTRILSPDISHSPFACAPRTSSRCSIPFFKKMNGSLSPSVEVLALPSVSSRHTSSIETDNML